MDAADHRRTATALQTRAEELQRVAARLEAEASALRSWFLPIGMRLLPHVWAGPAADRATDGYWQARRTMAGVVDDLDDQVRGIRAQAETMLDDAADHVRTAAAKEAAAAEAAKAAAAAEDDEVEISSIVIVRDDCKPSYC